MCRYNSPNDRIGFTYMGQTEYEKPLPPLTGEEKKHEEETDKMTLEIYNAAKKIQDGH